MAFMTTSLGGRNALTGGNDNPQPRVRRIAVRYGWPRPARTTTKASLRGFKRTAVFFRRRQECPARAGALARLFEANRVQGTEPLSAAPGGGACRRTATTWCRSDRLEATARGRHSSG